MKFLLQTLLFFTISLTFAQDFNIPFREKEKWGYANKNGEIITKPIYDSVSIFSYRNRWEVYKNGKKGIIDSKGKELFATEYDSIIMSRHDIDYHEYQVFKNGLVGYADMYGNLILPIEYKSIAISNGESYYELPNKFFVEKYNSNFIQLIDLNKSVILDSISKIQNTYRKNYIITVKNEVGIFNTMKKEWEIKPEFKSISHFLYENYNRKKEYINYEYYGIKDNKIVLFDDLFHQFPTNKNNLIDFFIIENSEQELDEIITMSSSAPPEREIFSATNSSSDNIQQFNTRMYNTNVKIIITKEKNKFSIKTNETQSKINKKFAFEEIKLFKILNKDEYDHRFALVRTKNKWQLFNLSKNDFISKSTFETFEFNKNLNQKLILKNKSKVGIFIFAPPFYESGNYNYIYIEPNYEKFKSLESVKYKNETTNKYENFDILIFESNKKKYLIGENQVKFYKD